MLSEVFQFKPHKFYKQKNNAFCNNAILHFSLYEKLNKSYEKSFLFDLSFKFRYNSKEIIIIRLNSNKTKKTIYTSFQWTNQNFAHSFLSLSHLV